MAYNNLSTQDYCNIIEGFVNRKYTNTFVGKFSETELYLHCINKTKALDKNDEEEIAILVHDVICALVNNGVAERFGGNYRIVRPITQNDCIRSFSMPQTSTKINQGIIDTLKGVDERTGYYDDPTSRPLTTEDEKAL